MICNSIRSAVDFLASFFYSKNYILRVCVDNFALHLANSLLICFEEHGRSVNSLDIGHKFKKHGSKRCASHPRCGIEFRLEVNVNDSIAQVIIDSAQLLGLRLAEIESILPEMVVVISDNYSLVEWGVSEARYLFFKDEMGKKEYFVKHQSPIEYRLTPHCRHAAIFEKSKHPLLNLNSSMSSKSSTTSSKTAISQIHSFDEESDGSTESLPPTKPILKMNNSIAACYSNKVVSAKFDSRRRASAPVPISDSSPDFKLLNAQERFHQLVLARIS